MTGAFTVEPRGPFSLAEAAGFGFGPTTGAAPPRDGVMRLAFAVDGFAEHAGVVLSQDARGVHAEVHGARDLEAVQRQVERILSLDHDGEAWLAVGERDPVIGRLQGEHAAVRPVLFHSPYEAAAWSIISARRPARQAAGVRAAVGEELGATFTLADETLAAFPLPERLLELEPMRGLPPEKVERLHGVAHAALEGRLDPERLQSLGPEEATRDMLELRGIGPFYASLIVIRATGFTDVLPAGEPKAVRAVEHFYGGAEPPSELWRPFRTWATVLLRFAADRAGL